MPSPHSVAHPLASSSHPTHRTKPSLSAIQSGRLYASLTSSPGSDTDTDQHSAAPASPPREASASHSNSYNNSNGYNNSSLAQPHISSALSGAPPSRAFFPAGLPRTSSLLPPSRAPTEPNGPKPPTFHNPFDAAPARGLLNDPSRESGCLPDGYLLPSTTLGALVDDSGNLHRWSTSTSSSRASAQTSLSRRLSVDAVGGVHTPRRIQTQRPAVSIQDRASPARDPTHTRRRSSIISPLTTLPHIKALPSLDFDVDGTSLFDDLTVHRPYQPADAHSDRESPLDWYNLDQPGAQHELLSSSLDSVGSLMAPALAAARDATMSRPPHGETRGHTRSRSTQNSSVDTTTSRGRTSRGSSQKAMLSKALQKANAAVEFDNAANFESARDAYSEACELLEHVLVRTPGDEDRRKLEAIRKTYTSRIAELDQLRPIDPHESKALPRRPDTGDRHEHMSDSDDVFAAASRTKPSRATRSSQRSSSAQATSSRANATPTPTIALESGRESRSGHLLEQYSLQSSFSKGARKLDKVAPPMDQQYMPPPLSPRRIISPVQIPRPTSPDRPYRPDSSASQHLAPHAQPSGHRRGYSHESISWLESIEESEGSISSSIGSGASAFGRSKRHTRVSSGPDAGFDAELDDVIEAAYDDGYDSAMATRRSSSKADQAPEAVGEDDPVARVLQRVEWARERVRESEREALELVNERERQLRMQLQLEDEEEGFHDTTLQDFYDGTDSDEEERILERMTQGYVIEDFTPHTKSRPSVPRESDSSGLTSRTWHSSLGSNPTTATTTLTSVSENTVISNQSKLTGAALHPPPTQALPLPPTQASPAKALLSKETVRDRRLSGQNARELKIETTTASPTKAPATVGTISKPGGYIAQQRQALSSGLNKPNGSLSARPAVSPVPGSNPREDEGALPITLATLADTENNAALPPAQRPGLRKNFSSSSLKSLKTRTLSVTNVDDTSDLSPGTPLTGHFGVMGTSGRIPAMPSLPTPVVASFKDRANNSQTGGLYLFDNEFQSPLSPRSAQVGVDAPAPLEPCPSDTLLRPFWLMRCLYQTLCHPRGGYISNKLFVPRDVWRVKGVKLKGVEDKIANCDLLTAALQKLSKADSNDADAVLDEMQALEAVLEQVQATLTRKLGNEVGVQNAGNMFREASADEPMSAVPRSGSVSGKGSSFSWRRLRNKNSSAGLGNSYAGRGSSGNTATVTTPVEGGGKETSFPSLPMTNYPTSRPPKREIERVPFTGPNGSYMSSLAKLFDAAQAIDQVARQVEDPGLRHADKTQVGLELCTRHAAEFFAFYICRFALGDLTLLLDKFVKRGSEWVMA